jgi:hypothetical protein
MIVKDLERVLLQAWSQRDKPVRAPKSFELRQA